MARALAAETDIERRILALRTVSRVYPLSTASAVLRSVAARGEGTSRVEVREGVVRVAIGTAAGSIARQVAHDVHELAVEAMAAHGLRFVRTEVEIATVEI